MLKMIALLFLLVIIIIAALQYPKFKLISGFTAKNMASSYFLADRSVAYTNKTDNHGALTKIANTTIQETTNTATSTVFGLSPKRAVYRKGVGAVLIPNDTIDNLDYLKPVRNFNIINKHYPFGNLVPEKHTYTNINNLSLSLAIEEHFKENNEKLLKNTRSVLVLYKGKIIAEKYALGFDENSLLQGWSMTKSLLTTCFGVLEKNNDFDIKKPVTDFPEWLQDKRKDITTNHLLRMESGLKWEEDYSKVCDVTQMLFNDVDLTERPVNKPLQHGIETEFNYSSGTSNILSALLRKQFKTTQEYIDFPYKEFIDKIGMHSMVIETDLANNYVASSYSWATTRDWGKFGQLMLDKGVWGNEQIVSSNWTNYISTPNKTSNGEYGGQWWLNSKKYMPNVPSDCFYADGYQGQRIFVIPSKDLVIVRFGLTQLERTAFYPLFDKLIGNICKTIL